MVSVCYLVYQGRLFSKCLIVMLNSEDFVVSYFWAIGMSHVRIRK